MIVLGFDTATAATVVGLLDDAGRGRSASAATSPPPGSGPATRPSSCRSPTSCSPRRAWPSPTSTGSRSAWARAPSRGCGSASRRRARSPRRRAPSSPASRRCRRSPWRRRAPRRPPRASWRSSTRAARRSSPPAGATAVRCSTRWPWHRQRSPSGCAGAVSHGWRSGTARYAFAPTWKAPDALVEPDGSPLHGVSAGAICRLALEAPQALARDLVVPDYLRPPDAAARRNRAAR